MTMGLVHAARQLESYGRGPDTSLAHISPDESAMLDYMQGGRRMNPATGLPEYSLFGKILKSVAKIGAATVGFMYGGPLGAAAASAAVSKLTGDSWKGALTTGAISGLTSGLGSYASGTRGLGNLATTTGKSLAAGALTPAVNFSPLAGSGANTVSEAVKAGTIGASGLGVLAPSNIMNAGYGAAGAALGAAIPNRTKPATPIPAPYQMPYDPNNVFSWMRKPSQQQIAVSPMNTYQNYAPEQYSGMMGMNQQMYADGGDVAPAGMGLPQSAAMPQLMSAAQWGYLNARTGGKINGPGDGKSDDIPALLSNGEHVIDAATVSDLGNGDNDTGQKRIEQFKQIVRRNAGRKNPHKASPKQKGLGSLLKSAQA